MTRKVVVVVVTGVPMSRTTGDEHFHDARMNEAMCLVDTAS